MKHNIIIADDHTLFTDGLVKLINSFGNYHVISTAANGDELLKLLNNRQQPDLIILDICMPKLNGIEAGKMLKQKLPDCKILVCTMYHTKNIKEQLDAFNPNGLISKAINAQQLESTLNTIMAGTNYFQSDYEYTDSCADTILQNDVFYQLQKLSEREKEVISYTKKGLSSRQIADELGLSQNTINNHKSNIYQKLGFNNSAALVNFANQANL